MHRNGRLEEKHANQERWLLTYADLITLLLVFFVVMYAASRADESKFAKLNASLQRAFHVPVLEGQDGTAIGGQAGQVMGNSVLEDYIALRGEVLKLAQDAGMQSQVDVAVEKDGIAISLSGYLLFDSGRAEMKQGPTKVLDGIADQLRHIPNDIRVEGHTDNIPTDSDLYPTNWELSTARATIVARYLAEIGGIRPARLSAQGYAEYRPVADNSTRENRALNRRVEILIVYPKASEGSSR